MDPLTFRTLDGSTARVTGEELDELANSLDGPLLTPDHADYEEARRVWNGMIDRHPTAIVRCGGVDDVVAAVRFAADRGLLTSVRGGGHHVAGTAVGDEALVIDLSQMRDVVVDPDRRRVRAGGGATIGDVDAATQAHGLAVPLGVVTETGVAGLTLGGGYGWLRAAHGLSCDNLVAARVVTAAGQVVTAGEGGDAELLWGLRGGGGNFGVVTELTFEAHPVGPEVYFAALWHPAEDAVAAVAFLRDFTAEVSPAVSTLAVLGHAPEVEEIPAARHGEAAAVLLAVHSGDPALGEKELAPLREFGRPFADWSATMPFVEVQQFFDEDYPKWEKRYYWKSAHVRGLDDDLIAELVRANQQTPSPESTIDIWPNTGAATTPPRDGAALSDRSAPYMLGIEANWDDPADDAANLAWARGVVDAAGPWATGARYLNFPGLHEDLDETLVATFGDGLERMARLKAIWDPTNFFRLNANIAPAASIP